MQTAKARCQCRPPWHRSILGQRGFINLGRDGVPAAERQKICSPWREPWDK